MPITKVTCDTEKITPPMVAILQKKLQQIVAEGLDVPANEEKKMSPERIILRFVMASKFDVGNNLCIEVFASDYAERVKNADERAATIKLKVRRLLGMDLSVTVVIWLSPCGVA